MTKAEIKKFVKEHKTEIIVGGVALVVGANIGSNHATRKCTKDINHWFVKNDYLHSYLRIPTYFTNKLGKVMKDAHGGLVITPTTKTTIRQLLLDLAVDERDKRLDKDCRGVVIFS